MNIFYVICTALGSRVFFLGTVISTLTLFFVHSLCSVKELSLREVRNTILSDVGISSYPVSPKTKKKNSRKKFGFYTKN